MHCQQEWKIAQSAVKWAAVKIIKLTFNAEIIDEVLTNASCMRSLHLELIVELENTFQSTLWDKSLVDSDANLSKYLFSCWSFFVTLFTKTNTSLMC